MSKWLLPVLVTGLAFAYFRLQSDYAWQLALLSGLAIGALTYVLMGTADQMLALFSGRDGDEPSGLSGKGP